MKSTKACVLTINGGSSSIKFALFQTGEPLERKLHGKVDRIGLPGTTLTFNEQVSRPFTAWCSAGKSSRIFCQLIFMDWV